MSLGSSFLGGVCTAGFCTTAGFEGLGTELVEAAGAGFVLPDVVAGAGGVDFVVEVVDLVAGFGTELAAGCRSVVLTTGLNSGAAGAVLAVVTVLAAGVTVPSFGTDVVFTDVVPVGAVVTGDFIEGTETAGFDCGVGGVDSPETAIFGVTRRAVLVAGAAGFATLPDPEAREPLPELADEPLLDGLGTELTLISFRRMVPLEPESSAAAAEGCSKVAEAAAATTEARNRFLKLNNMLVPCRPCDNRYAKDSWEGSVTMLL